MRYGKTNSSSISLSFVFFFLFVIFFHKTDAEAVISPKNSTYEGLLNMFLILFKFVVFFFYFKRCFIAKFQNLKPTRNIVNILNNAATPRSHCFKILLFSKTFAKKTILLFKTKIL